MPSDIIDQKKWQSPHIAELDSLRAFAILAVFQYHFYPDAISGFPSGPMGVQLFFVLSGFLITGILLSSKERIEHKKSGLISELKIFYVRRCLRIMPVYYFVIFVAAAIGIPAVSDFLFWHLLYLTNVLVTKIGTFPYPAGVLWTLAVEEQFYLIWPLGILLTPRKWLVPAMVAMIAGSIAFRELVPIRPLVLLPGHVDALAAGALLATLRRKDLLQNVLTWCLPVLALLAFIAFPLLAEAGGGHGFIANQSKLPLVIYGATIIHLVVTYQGAKLLAWLRLQPILYLGRISYGMYLYHQFIAYGFGKSGIQWHPAVKFVALGAVTIAVAAASWHFMEKPLNDLKRFFPYRSRGNVGSEPRTAEAA